MNLTTPGQFRTGAPGEIPATAGMKVTIGRIVHYKTQTGNVYPAIVVNVMASGKVNLQVFLDEAGSHWISSVDFSDDVSDFSVSKFLPGTWRWPPRES